MRQTTSALPARHGGRTFPKRYPGNPLLSPPLLPVEKLRLTLGEVLREADADPELGPPEEPVSAGTWVIRVLPVLLVPSALLLWRRRHRLNTAPAVRPLRRAAVGGRQVPGAVGTRWVPLVDRTDARILSSLVSGPSPDEAVSGSRPSETDGPASWETGRCALHRRDVRRSILKE